jgi:hypothetical protein
MLRWFPPIPGGEGNQMKTKAIICILASIAGLQAASREEREKFADKIVNADAIIAAAQKVFMKDLKPFEDGQPGDVAALEHSYQGMIGAVANAKAAANFAATPSNSPDCVELKRAFLGYVEAEKTVIAELGDVVAKVKAGNGKLDLLGKLQVIGDLKKCGEAEDPARQKFMDAAREYDRVDHTL